MWIAKLKQIVSDLQGDPSALKPRVSDLWKTAGTTLARTGMDKMRCARVIAMRDFEGLKAIVADLEANPQLGVQTRYVPSRPAAPAAAPGAVEGAGGAAVAVEAPAPAATALAEPVNEADLNSALKAFRKRLKVTQLDEESKLGARIVGSKKASVVAITPPTQFPRAIWEALAERGKLKRAGSGLYELIGN